jgi:hypothetical protein
MAILMVMVLWLIPMEHGAGGPGGMDKCTELVSSIGPMDVPIKAKLTICYMAMVSNHGPMEEGTRDMGGEISDMDTISGFLPFARDDCGVGKMKINIGQKLAV